MWILSIAALVTALTLTFISFGFLITDDIELLEMKKEKLEKEIEKLESNGLNNQAKIEKCKKKLESVKNKLNCSKTDKELSLEVECETLVDLNDDLNKSEKNKQKPQSNLQKEKVKQDDLELKL